MVQNKKYKILIIRFSSIGDIVLTTPVIRCLYNQLNCEIHYLTKIQNVNILQPSNYIKKIYSYDGKNLNELIKSLKLERFDFICDLHNNIRSKKVTMERWENEQNNSEMMIYTTEDGLTKIETTFDGDTVWLSIDQMAELFQRDKSTISRHIKNIFTEGELKREAVVANFATTAADGKTYQVDYYNLDVIISVGYRVKSQRGVQFRIWATGILKEYMRKGFALDDERLKNLGGGGYFKELLERIRDIRASEKVFYRQVLEI